MAFREPNRRSRPRRPEKHLTLSLMTDSPTTAQVGRLSASRQVVVQHPCSDLGTEYSNKCPISFLEQQTYRTLPQLGSMLVSGAACNIQDSTCFQCFMFWETRPMWKMSVVAFMVDSLRLRLATHDRFSLPLSSAAWTRMLGPGPPGRARQFLRWTSAALIAAHKSCPYSAREIYLDGSARALETQANLTTTEVTMAHSDLLLLQGTAKKMLQ